MTTFISKIDGIECINDLCSPNKQICFDLITNAQATLPMFFFSERKMNEVCHCDYRYHDLNVKYGTIIDAHDHLETIVYANN